MIIVTEVYLLCLGNLSGIYIHELKVQTLDEQRHNGKEKEETKEFTLASVGTKSESESICAAFWDAIWVV